MNASGVDICRGAVMHARSAPVRTRFAYRLFFLRIRLEHLGSMPVPMLAVNRWAPMSFHYRDHGARDGSHPLPWIRGVLQREGLACADGDVVLQTLPRLFGYVFNPVSFWFCHDRAGALRAVLCEVSNTFGERHNYLVAHPDGRPIAPGEWMETRKVFHVSPFFPVSGRYRFRFQQRGAFHAVAIDYHDGEQAGLVTRLSGRARPLTRRSAVAALLAHPLMTLAVIARIHVQAFHLWRARVPFFRKPHPPLQDLTR
ncbi:DUF1365 domain-containing protein [Methyloversatilis thermotolerans]|uniref:DUF1365 domain-containing protein n=1 Tax=Methyloversatilis thermotolerans TaxID=1346290 RepID=UPI0003A2023D|nr:DUF1365 domain-containing protein [Methyloversatilis thermotolerans]